jgi:2-polyprenyl-3-methyl-5-hydroxy-6-metoxy-1,4-benzoquinol methylase
LSDYRAKFYARYDIAGGKRAAPSERERQATTRQFRGRWGHLLPVDPDARILDVGCGSGELIRFLRSAGYGAVGGIDHSAAEVARAAAAGVAGVECADATTWLAQRRKTYDAIFALNLFEHLRKDEILALLGHIHEALRPGGRLLAVTPNGLSPFGGATRYWDFSHETGFTPASWRQLARLTGFGEPRFEEYGPMAHSVAGCVRSALWQLVRLVLVGISYVEVGGPRDPSWTFTADMKIILTKP